MAKTRIFRPTHRARLHFDQRSIAMLLAACIACLSAVTPGTASASLPESTAASVGVMSADAVLAQSSRLEAYVRDSMANWQAPGVAVGLIAEDRLVYQQGFGVREQGKDAPVTPHTVFQIGSTSKAFLGATLAMLVDQGKLAWSDRVVDHLPDFRMADPWVTREFRVDDLISQRSGLPPFALTEMMLLDYAPQDVVHALAHVQPETSFRSTYAYQNALHLVAGRLVAQRAGTPDWQAFLQHQLLEPLGMVSASATHEAMAASPHRATGHTASQRGVEIEPLAYFPYNAGGAGGLNASLLDLSRWVRWQINNGELEGKRLLSAEAMAATRAPRILLDGFMAPVLALGPLDTQSYAMGWITHTTPHGRVVEHSGGTMGFNTYVAFDPDRRIGVVILVNHTVGLGDGLAVPLGKYALALLQQRPVDDYAARYLSELKRNQQTSADSLMTPEGAMPVRPLQAYAGAYDSPAMGRVMVRPEGEGLAFTVGPRAASVSLRHWSGDVFVTTLCYPKLAAGGLCDQRKLRFLTNERNEISGFDWSGGTDAAGLPLFVRATEGH